MDERKIDRTDEEGLIDLSRLLREARSVLRRLYWLPLALAAVMALLICLHGWRSYQPMYASEATFTIQVVSGTGSDIAGGGYGYYDKATAEQLGKTFPYLIQSDLMRGKLCRAMGVTTLNGTITAQTVSDTNLFTIRVTSPSAQDAKAILDKVIELYPDVAGYVIGSTSMNLLTQPQAATEPYNAFHPLRSAAKGAALGLVLGLAVVLLCAAARRTVRDTEDVRMKLNQTCLAALPKVRFKQRGKSGGEELMSIQNEHVPSAFQEGVRSLRIKLLRELPEGEGCRTILVTSTLPGEGKTTVAVNLAQSLSRGGARVILVDLDMRKPSVKRAMGVTIPSVGVVELIERRAGKKAPEVRLLKMEGTELYLLAGDTGCRDTQQMNSRRLSVLLESLRDRADYIILDTPPLRPAGRQRERRPRGGLRAVCDGLRRGGGAAYCGEPAVPRRERHADRRLRAQRRERGYQPIRLWLWVRVRLWLRRKADAWKETGRQVTACARSTQRSACRCSRSCCARGRRSA